MIQLENKTLIEKAKRLKEILKNNLPVFVLNNIRKELAEVELEILKNQKKAK
jgi:hypothetical protein